MAHSKLQKIHSQTNWAIYFKLHPFPMGSIDSLHISERTAHLIGLNNKVIHLLKLSIKKDAARSKQLILLSRKKKHLDE